MPENFSRMTVAFFFAVLIVLSFFVIRPIFAAIFISFILAYIFTPVYNRVNKYVQNQNVSASIIVVLLLVIIILPIWFFTPILLNQSLSLFQATQQIDFVKPLKDVFPSLFASQQFSNEVGSILSTFVTKIANSLVNLISDIILNFPTIALQITVVFFTFFFVLRDQGLISDYIKSILPFSKEVNKKFVDYSKLITSSILYGQIVVGIVQGLIVGLAFFIFGVPNALLLTIFVVIAGIFPIVGTPIIWVPVALYLFIAGNAVPAWGIIIFGLISSLVEHILRPVLVSKRTKIHSGILLVSTVGGIFFFGILGFIIGPIVVSYLLLLIEVYRGKPTPGVIIEEQK